MVYAYFSELHGADAESTTVELRDGVTIELTTHYPHNFEAIRNSSPDRFIVPHRGPFLEASIKGVATDEALESICKSIYASLLLFADQRPPRFERAFPEKFNLDNDHFLATVPDIYPLRQPFYFI